MNEKNFALAENLISATYVSQGQEAIRRRENQVTNLLSHKKIPEEGWDDQSIEYEFEGILKIRLFLNDLSLMDSNNFLDNSGVGEREGRIESNLVFSMGAIWSNL